MNIEFKINDSDGGLVITTKREANIILASLDKKSKEYAVKKEQFIYIISIMKTIENTMPDTNEELVFIFKTINRIFDTGILSPLTLKDDEFVPWKSTDGYYDNSRYNYIRKDKNRIIYNDNAFNCYVRACYDHKQNAQIKIDNELLNKNHRIFISKGGVITGEYIEKCIIRQEIVDKHCFTIQSVLNIPVGKIIDGDLEILFVDHREPKLKVLNEFYDVPISIDGFIANTKYNIRKYKKLK